MERTIPIKLNPWIGVLRIWTLTAALIPVALGAVLSAKDESFSWLILALTLVSGCLLQISANLLNTYGDFSSGVDTRENPPNTPQLVLGLLQPRAVLFVGALLLGAGSGLGVVLAALSSWRLLWFAAAGVAGAGLYTTGLRYKYLGLGVPLVILTMGVTMVSASYFAHTMTLNWFVVFASLPVASLVGAILHGNDLRDMGKDQSARITTWPLVLGERGARLCYLLLHSLPYLLVGMGMASGWFSYWLLLPFLCLPLTLLTLQECGRNVYSRLEGASAAIHFTFGVLYVLALWL